MYVREILLYILLKNKNLTETVTALNKIVNIIDTIWRILKNIKKINEKCIEDKKVINLGFLMINYGTSRV